MVNIDWEEYYDQKYDDDRDYELEEQVKLALTRDNDHG